MTAIPQHILASQKTSIDNLVAIQNSFFQGFEKLVDLNLKVVKASLEEAAQKSQEAIELKDAQEALAFTSGLTQPSAEKALAYGKPVYDIGSGVQHDLTKPIEEQMDQNQKKVPEDIEQFTKNAPAAPKSTIHPQ